MYFFCLPFYESKVQKHFKRTDSVLCLYYFELLLEKHFYVCVLIAIYIYIYIVIYNCYSIKCSLQLKTTDPVSCLKTTSHFFQIPLIVYTSAMTQTTGFLSSTVKLFPWEYVKM